MAREDVLVSTAWLAEHLHDPDLRIIDIRGHVLPASQPPPHYFNHHADYLRAHIPGAVFVDWVREITDPADPRHARLAPPERYAEVMSRCGVSDSTKVVAYDDAGGMFAARLWWTLQYYGHAQACVLDGGWQAWCAEGREVSDVVAVPPSARFIPRPQPDLIRSGDQVAGRSPDAVLVDVRSPEEFRGDWSRAGRNGHIPGAVNLPRGGMVGPDGHIPPQTVLEAQFASIAAQDGDEVVFYCNAGVSASYGLLAWRAAGRHGGAVYDGSWKDWGNDASRPIVQG